MTEREICSIIDALKDCRNTLLGHDIEAFTDHRNAVHKHFNAGRVMPWQLLLEDFGPELIHLKGGNNEVGDGMSQLLSQKKTFLLNHLLSPEVACESACELDLVDRCKIRLSPA